jgi:transposase
LTKREARTVETGKKSGCKPPQPLQKGPKPDDLWVTQADRGAGIRHHHSAGVDHIAKRLPEILEDHDNALPGVFRQLLKCLSDHLKELDRQVLDLEGQIQTWHRENEARKKLPKIPGIGPNTASALVTSIGDAKIFSNNRQLAALVEHQQTRECLPDNLADSWCQSGNPSR